MTGQHYSAEAWGPRPTTAGGIALLAARWAIRAAFHEAAHAVAAIVLGEGSRVGQTQIAFRNSWCRIPFGEATPAWVAVDTLLAGEVAARKAVPVSDQDDEAEVAAILAQERVLPSVMPLRGSDAEKVLRILVNACPDLNDGQIQALYRDRQALVGQLVAHPVVWRCICGLATALVQHQSLSGDQVRNVVGAVFSGKAEPHSPPVGQARRDAVAKSAVAPRRRAAIGALHSPCISRAGTSGSVMLYCHDVGAF